MTSSSWIRCCSPSNGTAHRSDSEESDDEETELIDDKKLLSHNNNNYERQNSGCHSEKEVLLHQRADADTCTCVPVDLQEKDGSTDILISSPDVLLHTAVSAGMDTIYKPTTLVVEPEENRSILNTNKCPSCVLL